MDKHPKKGVNVIVYYRRKDSRAEGFRYGQWDGAHWVTKDVYSDERMIPFPGNLELIGWKPLDK